jgi:hypothetical protein
LTVSCGDYLVALTTTRTASAPPFTVVDEIFVRNEALLALRADTFTVMKRRSE